MFTKKLFWVLVIGFLNLVSVDAKERSKNNYLLERRDFKINFSRPLFTIIFRPKMVFFDTDSILRVKLMYESVK